MTVKIMAGKDAVPEEKSAVHNDSEEIPKKEHEPKVYLTPRDGYETAYTFTGTRRRRQERGIGSVLMAQTVSAAVIAAAAWASVTFGSDAVKEICTHLADVFR